MHRVTITAGNLRFSAAHFISFAGKCERLHGHNYAVTVTLEGGLTSDSYVFDFVELKHVVKDMCDRLDHRFLLPACSACLGVKRTEAEVEILAQGRRYVFPREDVLELPVDSITAERLAEYFAGELAKTLTANANITLIEAGVEEAPGQTAYFRLPLREHPLDAPDSGE